MPKSRKLRSEAHLIYCRKCQKEKNEQSFYSAVDTYVDSNGFFSICKDCVNEIYVLALNTEMDMKKAIYKTCKIINLAYVEEAIESTLLHLDTKGMPIDSAFGVYKAKLGNYFRVVKDIPQTFESFGSTPTFNAEDAKTITETQGEDFSEYLRMAWGNGMSIDDYNFLESTLSDWKNTHKCDTTSELTLIREICQSQLAIRKAREQGLDTKTLVKSMQEIIKTANLSPAQANMSNASKGNEVFGMWIKDIEQLEPAEWWDTNRNPFIDVDNIAQYFEDFVTRPIKNFLTRSKDFVVQSGMNGSLDIELKELEDGDGE